MKNIKTLIWMAVITLVIIFLSSNTINAQRLKPGPRDLSFFSKVDETDQPYAVYSGKLTVKIDGKSFNIRTGDGVSFMGSKIEILKNYKDFILFRETPDNLISAGYFDNNWNLPAEAGAAMKTSGVVRIK